jgi:putative hydrolase of the HAD superfamily
MLRSPFFKEPPMPKSETRSGFNPQAAFAHIDTWVFDLDNTLYPVECRLFEQVDRRMEAFIAERLSLAPEAARRLQKDYWKRYGTTLRGLMLHHDIAPAVYLEFVHQIDLSILPDDPALKTAIASLPGRKVIFTNGPAHHAAAVLDRLGIAGHFETIFDIASFDYIPKPEQAAYRHMLETLGADPARCVLFEDTVENLAPAAALGMTTVLVAPKGLVVEVRTQSGDHVHHVIDDLAGFLGRVVSNGEKAPDGPTGGRG